MTCIWLLNIDGSTCGNEAGHGPDGNYCEEHAALDALNTAAAEGRNISAMEKTKPTPLNRAEARNRDLQIELNAMQTEVDRLSRELARLAGGRRHADPFCEQLLSRWHSARSEVDRFTVEETAMRCCVAVSEAWQSRDAAGARYQIVTAASMLRQLWVRLEASAEEQLRMEERDRLRDNIWHLIPTGIIYLTPVG